MLKSVRSLIPLSRRHFYGCEYIEDIQVCSINTRFISLSGDSHEWNIIIFIPQDENKSAFIEKLEFSVYYILSVVFNNSVVIKIDDYFILYLLIWILKESSPTGDQWKYWKYVSLQWKINFYSENTENENKNFILSIFSNISFNYFHV